MTPTNPDEPGTSEAALAETQARVFSVPCPHCRAEVGKPCVGHPMVCAVRLRAAPPIQRDALDGPGSQDDPMKCLKTGRWCACECANCRDAREEAASACRTAALEEARQVALDSAREAATVGPKSNSIEYWGHREVEATSIANRIARLSEGGGTKP